MGTSRNYYKLSKKKSTIIYTHVRTNHDKIMIMEFSETVMDGGGYYIHFIVLVLCFVVGKVVLVLC